MSTTKVAKLAVEAAKDAFLQAMRQRREDGKGATIIAENYADLVADLELTSHTDSHVKAAIKQMHSDGIVQSGHAALHELPEFPLPDRRTYKITMLIK